MPDTRQPDAQTFNLGHYEQMQVSLAIQHAINPGSIPFDEVLDLGVLRKILPMFNSGTTQITHQPDSI